MFKFYEKKPCPSFPRQRYTYLNGVDLSPHAQPTLHQPHRQTRHAHNHEHQPDQQPHLQTVDFEETKHVRQRGVGAFN